MSEHKNQFTGAVKIWLPLAIAIVIFSGLAYAVIQQNYRMSANDPQIQIAHDVAEAISQGAATPENIVSPRPTTDIASSLATFVVIYNATGTPIGSSVALDGKLPAVPSGVTDHVKQKGENRITWQPKPGVRIAAVVTKYDGPSSGFVLVGRSIKEIEVREQQALIMSAAAGLLALVLTFLVIFLFAPKRGIAAHEHADSEHKHGHTDHSPETK